MEQLSESSHIKAFHDPLQCSCACCAVLFILIWYSCHGDIDWFRKNAVIFRGCSFIRHTSPIVLSSTTLSPWIEPSISLNSLTYALIEPEWCWFWNNFPLSQCRAKQNQDQSCKLCFILCEYIASHSQQLLVQTGQLQAMLHGHDGVACIAMCNFVL